MRTVGIASEIKILASDDAYLSYSNSPYIGHALGTAIDIYPAHQEWGSPVLSPVSGKIVKVKKIRMGASKAFPTDEHDYGIAIQPDEENTNIARIMHCEPHIKEGERIDSGDILGHVLRSRYFNYWTGPHYHAEIMPMEYFSRSSKSCILDTTLDATPHQFGKMPSTVEVLVSDVSKDRAIVYPQKSIHARVKDLYGLSIQDKDEKPLGLADAGLSHYDHGGVIGKNGLQRGDEVYFGEVSVGKVNDIRKGLSSFKRNAAITVSIDGRDLRGLSCFIYPLHYMKRGSLPVVLIPKKYGDLENILEQDSTALLTIRSYSNMNKT
jgi:hypothetical protein